MSLPVYYNGRPVDGDLAAVMAMRHNHGMAQLDNFIKSRNEKINTPANITKKVKPAKPLFADRFYSDIAKNMLNKVYMVEECRYPTRWYENWVTITQAAYFKEYLGINIISDDAFELLKDHIFTHLDFAKNETILFDRITESERENKFINPKYADMDVAINVALLLSEPNENNRHPTGPIHG